MKYNTITGALVASIILGIASFYGGITYAKNQAPARGQFGNGQFGVRGNRNGMGGFTSGEILSKDATSVTVKMQDGSTKIVLFGTSTEVMKATTGSIDDLTTGTNVVVTGSANSDGSVNAQNIQIRPAGMRLGGPRRGDSGAQQTQ